MLQVNLFTEALVHSDCILEKADFSDYQNKSRIINICCLISSYAHAASVE